LEAKYFSNIPDVMVPPDRLGAVIAMIERMENERNPPSQRLSDSAHSPAQQVADH
jgi:hypothetical protein